MTVTGEAKIIIRTISGKEAETVLAQAQGFRLMSWEMLNGTADRDPREFVARCKAINQRMCEEGA